MGRGKSNWASVQSENTVTFGPPYGGPQRATLTFRRHLQYGKDVILSLPRAQFLCRRDSCSVLVRFDQGKPARFSAVEPADYSSDTIFIRGFDRFVNSARTAKIVRVEAQFYREGDRVFEFNVAGLKWAGADDAQRAVAASALKEKRDARWVECFDRARGLPIEEYRRFMDACPTASVPVASLPLR